jgi:hypothetical protein
MQHSQPRRPENAAFPKERQISPNNARPRRAGRPGPVRWKRCPKVTFDRPLCFRFPVQPSSFAFAVQCHGSTRGEPSYFLIPDNVSKPQLMCHFAGRQFVSLFTYPNRGIRLTNPSGFSVISCASPSPDSADTTRSPPVLPSALYVGTMYVVDVTPFQHIKLFLR